MANYDKIPSDEVIQKTITALKANGFNVQLVLDRQSAKETALALLPKGAEVFAATSKTLEALGLRDVIDESGEYNSVRKKILVAAEAGKDKEKKRASATPDYVVGSAHALTHDGKIMVASGTGSQLSSEVYGADHVIYIIGAQKIVRDIQEGIDRIATYAAPLESKRLQEVYSNKDVQTTFSKLFIYNKEMHRDVHVIVLKENIGF